MSDTTAPQKSMKQKEKDPDITFYHTDLFEVPKDSTPPFLKGYRCKKCGELDFPKTVPCPKCWGKEFEMVPLSRRGKLYSVSDIYVGQPGKAVPYIIGYIDLPEDIRIFAQFNFVFAMSAPSIAKTKLNWLQALLRTTGMDSRSPVINSRRSPLKHERCTLL